MRLYRKSCQVTFIRWGRAIVRKILFIIGRYVAANPNQKAQRNETVALLAWK